MIYQSNGFNVLEIKPLHPGRTVCFTHLRPQAPLLRSLKRGRCSWVVFFFVVFVVVFVFFNLRHIGND